MVCAVSSIIFKVFSLGNYEDHCNVSNCYTVLCKPLNILTWKWLLLSIWSPCWHCLVCFRATLDGTRPRVTSCLHLCSGLALPSICRLYRLNLSIRSDLFLQLKTFPISDDDSWNNYTILAFPTNTCTVYRFLDSFSMKRITYFPSAIQNINGFRRQFPFVSCQFFVIKFTHAAVFAGRGALPLFGDALPF